MSQKKIMVSDILWKIVSRHMNDLDDFESKFLFHIKQHFEGQEYLPLGSLRDEYDAYIKRCEKPPKKLKVEMQNLIQKYRSIMNTPNKVSPETYTWIYQIVGDMERLQ